MTDKLAFALILVIVLTIGCKDKVASVNQPPAQKPATASSTPAVKTEEPKVEKEVYVYDPKGRRDPFMSLVQVVKPKTQRKKGATPVEDFGVDDIKLIAIAWDNKQYYALVTLPDGKSYTIRKGMTLGVNNGKVINITGDSVLIREELKDYKGQSKSKDTILKLRKEGEE